MDFQEYRDELTRDGLVYDEVHHVSEPLNFAFGIDYHIKDSIVAKTAKGMDYLLDRVASKITRRLLKEIKVHNEDRFVVHYDIKVKHLSGTRAKRGENKITQYLPFTLRLSDGQILTALVANTSKEEYFNGKKEVSVSRWALNNKDITSFIYPDGKRDIDSSLVAERLAKVINSVHVKFIKKNPNASVKVKTLEELEALEIIKDNIVWTKEEKKPRTPPRTIIPKVEEDEPDIEVKDTDDVMVLDAHARKLDSIEDKEEWDIEYESFFATLEASINRKLTADNAEEYIPKLFLRYKSYHDLYEKG